jgi:hypothetical protein
MPVPDEAVGFIRRRLMWETRLDELRQAKKSEAQTYKNGSEPQPILEIDLPALDVTKAEANDDDPAELAGSD